MLGGLMRGTMGAFIRGGLDTATQAIQQVNVADEEQIVQKLENFGAKKTKYNEGMAEYQAESKLIDDVAATLAIQDDDFLQGIDEQDMRSVARSLISMSGASDAGKAVEYFTANRDNLSPKKLAVSAPSVSASEQTSQMLSTSDATADEPEQPHFLKRIFTGKSDAQIKAEVINRAGVSEEMYDQVMAGTMPQRPDMTMGLAIGKGDQYAEIIKDNNTGVLAAIKTGSPIYETPEGTELARSYMQKYAAYGAKTDDAPSATELLDLQSQILTFAAPPEAKDFFGAYDSMLTSMNTLLFSDNITGDQRGKAMPLYKEIMTMKRNAIADPIAFGSNPDNANTFSEKVFELAGMLDVGSNGDRFKLVGTLLDDALKHARTNSDQYTAESLELLFQMPQQLQIAKDKGDMSIVDGIYSVLQDTIPVKPEGGEDETDYTRRRADLTQFYMSEQGGGHDEETAYNMAVNHLGSGGLVTIDGIPHTLQIVNGRQMVVPVPIGRADGSGVQQPRPKVVSENNSKISKNTNSINDLGRAIELLQRNPNGFNMIGNMILRTQDGIDMANSMGMNIPGFEQSATEIQEMRQRTIPLISTAKDALFEDPRLSDQDLRIVLDYVAVINDAGIGTTRGMQALLGLTEALAMDSALRLHQNSPDVKIVNVLENGRINIFNEQGELDLDSTIAGRTMKSLASAQGFQILGKEAYQQLQGEQLEQYKQNMARVTAMTQRVIGRVNSFRDLKGDTKAYRDTYANHSSLFSYSTVITPASAVATEIEAGQQRLTNRTGN